VKTEPIRWREQIREAALRFLAKRSSVTFSLEEITRRIQDDHAVDREFDESHVNDALALLSGYGLVERIPRPLSGLEDFKVTAQGVVFMERNYGR